MGVKGRRGERLQITVVTKVLNKKVFLKAEEKKSFERVSLPFFKLLKVVLEITFAHNTGNNIHIYLNTGNNIPFCRNVFKTFKALIDKDLSP